MLTRDTYKMNFVEKLFIALPWKVYYGVRCGYQFFSIKKYFAWLSVFVVLAVAGFELKDEIEKLLFVLKTNFVSIAVGLGCCCFFLHYRLACSVAIIISEQLVQQIINFKIKMIIKIGWTIFIHHPRLEKLEREYIFRLNIFSYFVTFSLKYKKNPAEPFSFGSECNKMSSMFASFK